MKEKSKILVVGSLVMDLIVSTPKFPKLGETVLGSNYTTASGGKGANQAVQVARLGGQVDMIGCVGRDAMGKEMLESLDASKVNTKQILVDTDSHSAVGNVQLEITGNKTNNRIIVVPGANMKIAPKDVFYLKNTIDQYDMVMMQHEIPLEVNEEVLKYAYEKKVKTMVNPAPSAAIKKELFPYMTYLSPNEHEAQDLTGIKITNSSTAQAAIKTLLMLGVKNVIITLGGKGAAFGNENTFFVSPSILTEKVVDPTAAGDSFIGAFCFAVCQGAEPQEAMEFANYAAHITVTRMGAQPSLPAFDEVKALIGKKNALLETASWLQKE